MPRPRQHPKNKKNAGQKKRSTTQTVQDLIAAAQEATESMQVEEAIDLYQRALVLEPSNYNLMDALADLCLQVGDAEEAFRLLSISTEKAPQTNPIKWMYYAQLCKGEDAVRAYRTGIDFLTKQLELLQPHHAERRKEVADLQREVISAYCGIAELYMTDLCFDPTAEESCETAIMNALVLDSTNAEALQTLASIRISQCRKPEACDILEGLHRRYDAAIRQYTARTLQDDLRCTDEDLEHINNLPTPEHCVALVKLLLECAPERRSFASYSEGLLKFVLQFDDENPEVWYLLGMSNKSMETPDVEAAIESFAQCRVLLEPLLKQLRLQRQHQPPAPALGGAEECEQTSIETLLSAVEAAEADLVAAHGEARVQAASNAATEAMQANEADDSAMEEVVAATVAATGAQPAAAFQFTAAAFAARGPQLWGPEEEEDEWSTDDEENAMDAS